AIKRQTRGSTGQVQTGISRIVRASRKSIDGPTESTTRRGDAIVEFGVGRSQTDGRSGHWNDHLVGVVNDGLETRRGDVIEETIKCERAGERRGTTPRREDVKQISVRIRSGRVNNLKIIRTVPVSINEDIDRDIARCGPFAMRRDSEEDLRRISDDRVGGLEIARHAYRLQVSITRNT